MKVARVDIVIWAANDALRIQSTVRHAAKLGAVYVVDASSTDGTGELARQAGAQHVEPGPIEARQNIAWALERLPLKGDWILLLGPDERVTPTLRGKIWRAAESRSTHDVFLVRRAVLFAGRLVRRGGFSPRWSARLLRRGAARVTVDPERGAHATGLGAARVVSPRGTEAFARLEGDLLLVRGETISQAVARYIELADFRAAGSFERLPGSVPRTLVMGSIWSFFKHFVLRGGIFEGRAGLHLALLSAAETYMTRLLLRERLLHKQSPEQAILAPPPPELVKADPVARTAEPESAPTSEQAVSR